MTHRHKFWVTMDGDDASCNRCGGRSHWMVGLKESSGHQLNRWRWWRRFKQHHSQCPSTVNNDQPLPTITSTGSS